MSAAAGIDGLFHVDWLNTALRFDTGILALLYRAY